MLIINVKRNPAFSAKTGPQLVRAWKRKRVVGREMAAKTTRAGVRRAA